MKMTSQLLAATALASMAATAVAQDASVNTQISCYQNAGDTCFAKTTDVPNDPLQDQKGQRFETPDYSVLEQSLAFGLSNYGELRLQAGASLNAKFQCNTAADSFGIGTTATASFHDSLDVESATLPIGSAVLVRVSIGIQRQVQGRATLQGLARLNDAEAYTYVQASAAIPSLSTSVQRLWCTGGLSCIPLKPIGNSTQSFIISAVVGSQMTLDVEAVGHTGGFALGDYCGPYLSGSAVIQESVDAKGEPEVVTATLEANDPSVAFHAASGHDYAH